MSLSLDGFETFLSQPHVDSLVPTLQTRINGHTLRFVVFADSQQSTDMML